MSLPGAAGKGWTPHGAQFGHAGRRMRLHSWPGLLQEGLCGEEKQNFPLSEQ